MSAALGSEAIRPLVYLAEVSKSYQDGEVRTEVLQGVDLAVEPGESVAIVGPSGSGKSTLLHVIGALDHYDQGTVEIAGRDLGHLTSRELAQFRNRKVGFVFQFQELLPDFTAVENVAVPARISGVAGPEAERLALIALEAVGLAGLGDRFPAQLSGGERQRVGLCRALINNPSLILADEPTGSLDEEQGEAVIELLLGLQREHGTTLILVTHNPEIATRCGRVLTLRDGRLA